MTKRGYNLQEFAAHTTNVNCLSMGKKTCRLLITGGDDHKVNVWAVGKPTSLMSLCGHISPVESLAFDSAEVLVLAGASSGVIKLWDLEETKMVRGLTGHRSNCTAMEFHPFGKFFASGSMDTNLKIWDIRKKGCIHTYKGHTRGISTIRFSPDGRWVVSGGLDNVVKVWDLTAGKLLNEFKFHEGHIRSMDFHPLEFLLATGSADGTVKFWDLETFELIGSSRPEASGVQSITFHPDGRTLFCGSDDCLKVYSWEPVVCHDSVDMGWSTLGDICINEGKLLGCSYCRDSVGVWVSDLANIEPYGRSDRTQKKFNLQGSYSSEKAGSGLMSTMGSRSLSPDYDKTKEIKNIYVDTVGSIPVASQKDGSLNSTEVVLPLDARQVSNLAAEKQNPGTGVNAKSDGQLGNKSFITPTAFSRDIPTGKDSTNFGKESITFTKTKPGMLLKPAHVRRTSVNKFEVVKLSAAVETGTVTNTKSWIDSSVDLNSQNSLVSEDGARKSFDSKDSNVKSVTEKSEKMLSSKTPPCEETCTKSLSFNKDSNTVKFVKGVAVVPGKTRTLVERFEQRDKLNTSCDLATDSPTPPPKPDKTSAIMKGDTQISRTQSISATNANSAGNQISNTEYASGFEGGSTGSQTPRREPTPTSDGIDTGDQNSKRELTPDKKIARNQNYGKESTFTSDRMITGGQNSRKEATFTHDSPISDGIVTEDQNFKRELTPDRMIDRNQNSGEESTFTSNRMITGSHNSRKESTFTRDSPTSDGIVTGDQNLKRELTSDRMVAINQNSGKESTSIPNRMITRNQNSKKESSFTRDRIITVNKISRRESRSASSGNVTGNQISRRESTSFDGIITRDRITRNESTSHSDAIIFKKQLSRREATSANDRSGPNDTVTENQISMRGLSSDHDGNVAIIESQISKVESISSNDEKLTECLMERHDIFLSTLRSRLTKLQVVRHFWEKNDIKGAIGALRKLPDHSVQADVISVLVEKMEILTLDLFPGLLPVLMGLLDSKTERHVNVSLEMLLKLVAIFGPMIRSTISARCSVGVDLHAEQRRECCNQCSMQLQKIQKLLPPLVRRGGAIGRCAQELNLALQE